MHVEAGTDAWDHVQPEQLREPRQVLAVGEFDVQLRAGRQRNREAGAFQQRRVIGGGRAGGVPVQAEQGREAEALRRLRPEQVVARHGAGDDAAFAAFQRVGHGKSRNCAVMVSERGDHGFNRTGRDQRAGRVMHQYDVRRVRRQRFQPGAHGILPGGAARHHRQMGQAGKRRGE